MGQHALIIDDCRFTTKILTKLVTELGFAVSATGSAEEAVTHVSTQPLPDLFLVDWVLPGMSGVDFIQQMRAHPTARAIPAVMVTGEKDPARLAEAMRLGADACLTKPFTREDIEAVLQQLGVLPSGLLPSA